LNGSKVATSGTALVFDGTNLGIGTTSPTQKLDVNGGAAVTGTTPLFLQRAVIPSFDGQGAPAIDWQFYSTGTTYTVGARIQGLADDAWSSTSAPTSLRFYTAPSGSTSVSERMRISNAGNVGIGTASPATKLNVVGTVTVDGVVDVNGGQIDLDTGQPIRWGGAASSIYAGSGTSDMVFTVGSSERFRVNGSSGNLGIGTSSPAARLDASVSNPTRGIVQRLFNSATSSQTGTQIQFAQNSVADWVIGQPAGTDAFAFWSGRTPSADGTERLRIDSSGNLGIGTSSPTDKLQVGAFSGNNVITIGAGTAGVSSVYFGDGTGADRYRGYIDYVHTSDRFEFGTSSTTKATLDSSGNLGIGTSSPGVFGVSSRNITVTAASGYSYLQLQGASGNGGAVDFGDNSVRHAEIASLSGSALAFYTNGSNSGNTVTERCRITAAGALLVGTTTIAGLGFSFQGNGYYDQYVGDSFGPNAMSTFYSDSGATKRNVAIIRVDGNIYNFNGVYGTLSDAKLKENIVDAKPKLESLCKVRVVNYNKIGDSSKHIGVIAQELEQVFPSLVDETPDRDAKGNDLGTTTKSVKYSVFVPMLIKAMQEQQAMINELMAKVAALETK
jgi:hypothetical protein